MRFTDKIALVVGAASGIGLETTKIMAEEGATVVGVDLNPAPLEALAEPMANVAGKIDPRQANAFEEDAARQIVSNAIDQYLSLIHI